MLIRICTEDKNSEHLRELTSKYFDGFTLLRGMGVWKGNLEPSLIIEIAADNRVSPIIIEAKIEDLVFSIKQANNQETVLVEYINSHNLFL